MDNPTLKLEARSVTGKKVKHLRAAGLVPASVCGRGVTPVNYVTDARIFGRVYQQVGRNALVDLQTPTGKASAFIREIQRHPITGVWLHVDFRIVDLRTPITVDVPVVLVGENIMVSRGEAIANEITNFVQVRALPADLPQNIEVDISEIADFTTVLHVSDLKLGDNVEVLSDPETPLATLNPSKTAAEEEEIIEVEQAEAEEAAAEAGEAEVETETDDDAEGEGEADENSESKDDE